MLTIQKSYQAQVLLSPREGYVKIAIIALPTTDLVVLAPPLPLAYIAGWMEQQRHIVRIYDLALGENSSFTERLEAVRAFRPHIILVAGEDRSKHTEVRRLLADLSGEWFTFNTSMRGIAPSSAAIRALSQIDHEQIDPKSSEQSLIMRALFALRDDLDSLPFPARHLLPIERYGLTSPSGALQTNIVIGQPIDGRIQLRNPRMIVSELRSIGHESGIWHVLFEGVRITDDLSWLHDFLYGLIMARTGVQWEASANYKQLNNDILRECRRAGCEGLRIEFDAIDTLDRPSERQELSAIVREARSLGLRIRGDVILAPRYSAIKELVDLAATFGLDDVTFHVGAMPADKAQPVLDLANNRYRSIQRRQVLIDRFGQHLGPVLWQIGRMGLLGRDWKLYAFGERM